ncbi:hypothetical protein RBH26_08635 [Natronolimnohabitans sp. A-GB9]|uniref:hypothetical protein n=1 Tax=Natronolimnohabitans sp. A-GB9 TaxID=3069757 RepID=UPI0027B12AB5|nr:hypothetical protein [Natronolimnohabitans sp. A-GB9]MDQ2050552.1 hypothetical protein [Natronolimnohabitans sp. A-GB9]
MAAHGFQGETESGTGTGRGVSLPDAIPFDRAQLTRLSWELGSDVVDDEEATRHSEWTHTGRRWALSIFRVTSNTVVIRVRTPVGRERFYGAAEQDLEPALEGLESESCWNRLDR